MTAGAGPIHAAYSVSNAVLDTKTVNFARTLDPCVKINAMCPGRIATRMGKMNGLTVPPRRRTAVDSGYHLSMAERNPVPRS